MNKKFLRENLIQNFVLKESKKYDIRLDHQKNLISFLYTAFIFKSIGLNDLVFENDEIVSIDGICFSKNRILITKKLFPQNNFQYPSEEEKKIYLINLWNTFLNEITC